MKHGATWRKTPPLRPLAPSDARPQTGNRILCRMERLMPALSPFRACLNLHEFNAPAAFLAGQPASRIRRARAFPARTPQQMSGLAVRADAGRRVAANRCPLNRDANWMQNLRIPAERRTPARFAAIDSRCAAEQSGPGWKTNGDGSRAPRNGPGAPARLCRGFSRKPRRLLDVVKRFVCWV